MAKQISDFIFNQGSKAEHNLFVFATPTSGSGYSNGALAAAIYSAPMHRLENYPKVFVLTIVDSNPQKPNAVLQFVDYNSAYAALLNALNINS